MISTCFATAGWPGCSPGIDPSVGSVGDAYDALMETINGLYKAECIRTMVFHDGPYRTDVEYATAGLVDW